MDEPDLRRYGDISRSDPLEGTIHRDFDALAPPDYRARRRTPDLQSRWLRRHAIGRHVGPDLGHTREPRTIRWDREPISRSIGLGLSRSEPRHDRSLIDIHVKGQ